MKKYALLLTVLFSLILIIPSFAMTPVTCYGPQMYEREKGKPFTETHNFTIVGLDGTGQLIIHNGGSDKKTRVSSAEIKFNGNLIFGPSDFNKNVEHLVAEVPLSENNEISVKLNGKPGGYLTAKVIKEEDADAAAVVGPEGLTLSVEDPTSELFGLILDIPKNALSEEKILYFSSEVSMPNVPYSIPLAPLVDFGPSGTIFEKPISITYKLNENIISNAGCNSFEECSEFLNVYFYDENDQIWRQSEITNIDYAQRTVTFSTNHFTVWVPVLDPWKLELALLKPIKKSNDLKTQNMEFQITAKYSGLLYFDTIGFRAKLLDQSESVIIEVPPDSTSSIIYFNKLNIPDSEQNIDLIIEQFDSLNPNGKEVWIQEVVVDYENPNPIGDILLDMFKPTLYFTEGEDFFPTDIEEVFDNGNILKVNEHEVASDVNANDLAHNSSNRHKVIYDGESMTNKNPTVYGSVIESDEYFYLVYMFYYHYDPKQGIASWFTAHDNDCERIVVIVKKEDTEWIAQYVLYGHHLDEHGQKIEYLNSNDEVLVEWDGDYVVVPWDNVLKKNETMSPIVFIAKDSHACYPRQGTYGLTYYFTRPYKENAGTGLGNIWSPLSYTFMTLPRLSTIDSYSTEFNYLLFSGDFGTHGINYPLISHRDWWLLPRKESFLNNENIRSFPFGDWDSDADGVFDDGDGSGVVGDDTCEGGETEYCDDNCPNDSNPDQADSDGDGIGDVCETCIDGDGDTYDTCSLGEPGDDGKPKDCNDDDNSINPGAGEICDGKNNDCDESSIDGFEEPWLGDPCDGSDSDQCMEGFFVCSNGLKVCSDNSGDNIEICDGMDNDCNPSTADGAAEPWIGAQCDGPDSDQCDEGTFTCLAGIQTCSDNTGDNVEICDDLDNDCNPSTADGAAEPWIGDACDGPDSDQCLEGTFFCSAGLQACNDDTRDNLEICDGQDNDCDGQVDEDVTTIFYQDADYDGFGNPAISINDCLPPAGYLADNTDCDDTNSSVYPGAEEICDDKDNQCPEDPGYGTVDEGCDNNFFIYVPNALEVIEGSSYLNHPFAGNARVQQVIDSSEFSSTSRPILINQLIYRPDSELHSQLGVGFTLTLLDFQINMSTTNAAPDSLSLNFSDNVGVDDTVVYDRGSLTITSANTGGTPRDFDMIIYLDTPFLYDPSRGNLLIDARNYGAGGSGPNVYLDAHIESGDPISVIYGLVDSLAASGSESRGHVIKFDVISVSGSQSDLDGDGYEGPVGTGEDCNDNDAAIYPGAPELCDSKDNQCPGDLGYGTVDEGCPTFPPMVEAFNITPTALTEGESLTANCTVTDVEGLDRVELWRAADSGGAPGAWEQIGTESVSGTTDFGNFTDAPSVGTYWYGIHVVDTDNNCTTEENKDCTSGTPNGGPDLGPIMVTVNILITCVDSDGDTYDTCVLGEPGDDGKPQDCDDNDDSIYPGAPEICDDLDNDCNPSTADGAAEPWIGDPCDGPDSDQCLEGTFVCSAGLQACNDDTGDNVEICDGIDNDCDGQIDEGVTTAFYKDADYDDYGNPAYSINDCLPPAGYVADNTDCDDDNSSVYPGAPELCDFMDNQCPDDAGYGEIDEGCEPSPPTNLSATYDGANELILISWDEVPGADSYNVYWDTEPGVTKSDAKLAPTSSTNHSHPDVDSGYTYYYRVAAENSAGESGLSSEEAMVYVHITWENTFGGASHDTAYSVLPTGDGGYITAGGTNSFGAGSYDVYLVKTDADGSLLWQNTIGEAKHEYALSMQPTDDGGYIIAGRTGTYGVSGYDVFLVKIDNGGNEQWQNTFGGAEDDVAFSVKPTGDGGYIIAGQTQSFDSGGSNFYLAKTDADGKLLWQKDLGGADWDLAYSVLPASDGGYIIAGNTYSFDRGIYDFYLVKTDADGNPLWQKTISGAVSGFARSMQPTSDGGYIIAGETSSFGGGNLDAYLIKIDVDGNLLWQKAFGGANNDSAHSVLPTSDGGYIIAGHTESFGAGYYDVYIVKTDADGNELWYKTFGGFNSELAYSVQPSGDGGYIFAGFTESFGAGDSDVYLIKADPNGNVD